MSLTKPDARAAAYQERLAALGVDAEVRVMDDSTHTAQEAADALGCSVAAIVKSLVFVADGEPLLVLASGPNRVDTALLSQLLDAEVAMADAKTVKRATGYSIGGVPPLAHATELRTVMDETLLRLDVVWAAAGSARAVFPIEPRRLAELANATIARVG